MITVEKIKLYDRYGGDGDGLISVGRKREKELLEGNEWAMIGNFYQDIHLINNGVADQAYTTQTIKRLQEQCDQDGFLMLANKISLYKDFQNVANILQRIRSYATWNKDTVWAGFDNAEHFLTELDQDIAGIEQCDFRILDKVCADFGPISIYQELAIANGWGKDCLQLADNFDLLYKRIIKAEKTGTVPPPKVRQTWLQKLFGLSPSSHDGTG